MWISNGGFADVFIVFAKVDGEHFTAFIVERKWPGVSSGKEEHKLGLHGSSTTPIILQDVKVPADAVLGEVGKGHKVAFNVLNFGRFKLGAMSSGGVKVNIAEAAKYAATRKQFNTPIATFGAIKHKLGEMTAREYALESMMYRTAGLIDQRINATPDRKTGDAAPMLRRSRSSRSKRRSPRCLAARPWTTSSTRTCRFTAATASCTTTPPKAITATRVSTASSKAPTRSTAFSFPGMLMKKALKGDLPLMQAAKALQDEIMSPSMSVPDDSDGVLAAEARACGAFKKGGAAWSPGPAMQRYGTKIEQEQEVLSFLADILIDTYSSESAVLRAQAAARQAAGLPNCTRMRQGRRQRVGGPHRALGAQRPRGDG
jgi:hypothetical protein